jgi:hypothetical protein
MLAHSKRKKIMGANERLEINKSQTYSCRHSNKKSFASIDRCSGMGG